MELRHFIFGTLAPKDGHGSGRDETILALHPLGLRATYEVLATSLDSLAVAVANAGSDEITRLIAPAADGWVVYARFFPSGSAGRDRQGRSVRRYQIILLDKNEARQLAWDPSRLEPFLHTGIVGSHLMLPAGRDDRVKTGAAHVEYPLAIDLGRLEVLPEDDALRAGTEKMLSFLDDGWSVALREAELGRENCESVVRTSMSRLLSRASEPGGLFPVPAAAIGLPPPVGEWKSNLDAQLGIGLCSLRPGHDLLPERWREFHKIADRSDSRGSRHPGGSAVRLTLPGSSSTPGEATGEADKRRNEDSDRIPTGTSPGESESKTSWRSLTMLAGLLFLGSLGFNIYQGSTAGGSVQVAVAAKETELEAKKKELEVAVKREEELRGTISESDSKLKTAAETEENLRATNTILEKELQKTAQTATELSDRIAKREEELRTAGDTERKLQRRLTGWEKIGDWLTKVNNQQTPGHLQDELPEEMSNVDYSGFMATAWQNLRRIEGDRKDAEEGRRLIRKIAEFDSQLDAQDPAGYWVRLDEKTWIAVKNLAAAPAGNRR